MQNELWSYYVFGVILHVVFQSISCYYMYQYYMRLLEVLFQYNNFLPSVLLFIHICLKLKIRIIIFYVYVYHELHSQNSYH